MSKSRKKASKLSLILSHSLKLKEVSFSNNLKAFLKVAMWEENDESISPSFANKREYQSDREK